MEKQSLSDICEYRKGKTAVSELTVKNYISTENLMPNKGGLVDATSLPSTGTTQVYYAGDVLVSNIRPYFKKIWLAKEDGGCSNDVLVFKAKQGVDSIFLYYVLANDKFFDYSMASSKGTKMPRGDKSAIMMYEVPKLDISVQKKIGEILRSIDEKIVVNNQINRNLSEQARLLYKSWFIDFDNNDGVMPDDWHVGTVSEIIELHDSKRKPLSGNERDKLEKIYPYYGATSIMDYVDNYLFDGNYLLLGEDGSVIDSEGYPILQYVFGKFWCNNHAHIITGKNGFSVEMLYLLFSLTHVNDIVTGAVQLKISQQNLNKVEVVIPSLSALKEFDELVQPMFGQIRKLRLENENLTTLRDSLLPKLMSGELDVSNLDI